MIQIEAATVLMDRAHPALTAAKLFYCCESKTHCALFIFLLLHRVQAFVILSMNLLDKVKNLDF